VRGIHRETHCAHSQRLPTLLMIFGLSAASAAEGCFHKASEGEACGLGAECADGLSCSEGSGKCEAPSPLTPSCDPSATGCAEDQVGFQCYGGQVPNAPYLVGCTAIPGSNAVYCCTSVPHCVDFGPCGDAGNNFECNDPVVPQTSDPSLACATIFSFQGGSSYCCISKAACFATELFVCGDAGQSYACTGDAAPGQYGLACSPGPDEDAGAKGTYCCTTDGGGD
jgi:hypothetical protein